MSKMSKKMDKQIQAMIGQYVKETDPDKAKELMQQIRELAEDQKTLDEIELRHQPIKKRNKIVNLRNKLKEKKEKEKLEKEILENALKEALKSEDPLKEVEIPKMNKVEKTEVVEVNEKES